VDEEQGCLEVGLGVVSDGEQQSREDGGLVRTTKCLNKTRLMLVQLTGQASRKIHRDLLMNAILTEWSHIVLVPVSAL